MSKKIVISIAVASIGIFILGFIAARYAYPQKQEESLAPTIETASADTTQEYINKQCPDDDSNVGRTECVIDLLDRTAAEREWKQRKLETIQHPQINVNDMVGDLATERAKIRAWRIGFEKKRDEWCEGTTTFVAGSGTPEEIAECKITIELLAIHDLNAVYYDRILSFVYDSAGIADFEPTTKDIDALVKTNLTHRGCVWAGEPDCDE